jgi:hypothetical protein
VKRSSLATLSDETTPLVVRAEPGGNDTRQLPWRPMILALTAISVRASVSRPAPALGSLSVPVHSPESPVVRGEGDVGLDSQPATLPTRPAIKTTLNPSTARERHA